MSEFIVQGIGFLGVLLFIVSYQLKSNRALYIMQTLGCAVFCLQFVMMRQYSGALSLLLAMARNLLLIRRQQWAWARWKGWLYVFSVLCIGVTVITWRGPLSLLPCLALLSTTLMYWSDNARRIRFANLVCASPCWLLYDVLIRSWGGMLNELITLGSILLSIYRYRWTALGENHFEGRNS